MSYKMQKRIQGSVSIFLVIIMVPMICISGLIVDGSRAELAKASVSSAGDLTMNAALANYDTVLKDVYGLFAMSQTADDLSANLYNYFADTLMANGIIESKEEIDSNPLLQDVASAFSGNSSNLLKMEISEDDFSASPLADSSLANPYVLKNQIVEYEKYRAPISSALSLLDGIASLKKIMQQSEVNKAKTTVDEKAGELNENSNDLYKALKEYVEKSKDFNPLFDTFSFRGEYYTYKKAFEEKIIPAYVRDLSESMPYGVGMKKGSDGKYTFMFDIHYLEYTKGKDGSKWSSFTGKSTQALLDELVFAYETFENGSIQDAAYELSVVSNIGSLTLKEKRSYATYYKMYMQKVYNLKNFYDAYKSQYDPNSDDTSFILAHETDITNIFENAYSYTKVLNTYQSEVDATRNFADDLLTALNSDLIQKIGWFAEIDTILTKAIDKLDDVEKKVTELNNANGTLKTKINKYNGSDDSDAFSKQMEQDYQYYKDNIDPVKISALKNKLTELKTYFKDVKDYLKSVKFCGYAASDDGCNTLSNLVTMTKNKTNSSGQTNIDYIESHVNDGSNGLTSFFKTQFEEGTKPATRSVSIDNDEFWLYLQQAFGVTGTEEDKEQETLKDDMKKDAGKADDATSSTNAYNSVSISEEVKNLLPSQGDFMPPSGVDGYDGSDKFSSLFDSITGALSDLMEGIKKAALAGRDNLYVTEYIFDMFTYNTMEAEIKVANNADKSKSLAELGIKLETSRGIEKSTSNNYMYGAEIEYILYGGFDAKSNISSAKTTIFCIRFLANSGYALTNSEIRSITLPPALAVQAATMGVVPYKLTQVVLQLCLALAESANDLRLMNNGEKVALIKTSDTWVMSPQGALNTARDLAKEAVSGVVREGAKKVTGVVNELIDKGAEKVKIAADDFLNDMTITINNQVSQLVGSAFSVFEEELIASLDSCLKTGKSVANDAATVANNAINSADAKARSIINSCSPTVRPIVEEYYNSFVGGKLEEYKSQIQSALTNLDSIEAGGILLDVQKAISNKLNSAVNAMMRTIDEKTKSLVDDLADKLGAKAGGYIEMGADKILEITNGYLDSTFDSMAQKLPDVAGKKSNSSSLASAIKFNYGDYLKMFVFLKLCIDDTSIMSRVADVIQLNINNALTDSGYTHPMKAKGKPFLMADAYTYVEVTANVKLKTLFISLPFFTEYSEKSGNYFVINYKSVQGY